MSPKEASFLLFFDFNLFNLCELFLEIMVVIRQELLLFQVFWFSWFEYFFENLLLLIVQSLKSVSIFFFECLLLLLEFINLVNFNLSNIVFEFWFKILELTLEFSLSLLCHFLKLFLLSLNLKFTIGIFDSSDYTHIVLQALHLFF